MLLRDRAVGLPSVYSFDAALKLDLRAGLLDYWAAESLRQLQHCRIFEALAWIEMALVVGHRKGLAAVLDAHLCNLAVCLRLFDTLDSCLENHNPAWLVDLHCNLVRHSTHYRDLVAFASAHLHDHHIHLLVPYFALEVDIVAELVPEEAVHDADPASPAEDHRRTRHHMRMLADAPVFHSHNHLAHILVATLKVQTLEHRSNQLVGHTELVADTPC